MDAAFDILSCDLLEPMLIPLDESFEPPGECLFPLNFSTNPTVQSQDQQSQDQHDQDVQDWADIT